MFITRLLKRTVFLSDRPAGKPEQFSILVDVPRPESGSDAAVEDARRETESVVEDAQAIFQALIASGALDEHRR